MNFKEKAGLLLQRIRPKLLAVDLDNTLWPGNCFETTTGPYMCNRFHPSPRTVACLDPKTGQGKTLSLYPDVREILEWLSSLNVAITICSRSPNKVAAMGILDTLGLWNLFILPQVYRSRKTYHFRNLRDCLDVDYKDCLHFDDCPQNVEAVSSIGVVAYQVTIGVGLSWETLLRGLELFESKHGGLDRVSALDVLQSSVPSLSANDPSPINTKELSPSSTKHVRWCLNPTYFEDSISELEKTDGDESTDESITSEDFNSPSDVKSNTNSSSISSNSDSISAFGVTGCKRRASPTSSSSGNGGDGLLIISPTTSPICRKKQAFSFPDSHIQQLQPASQQAIQ